jgi:monofunctional biosynthetic peptidoglycan transglycosylase
MRLEARQATNRMLAHVMLARAMRRALFFVVAVGAVASAYAIYVMAGLPSRREVRILATRDPGKTGVMRQREEESRRAKRAVRTRQAVVPLSRVSRYLINAVIVAEDPKFFGHEGIDWEAIKESAEVDVRKGRFFRGGSTITQQLAKNLFFTTRKSITRKLRELVVTRWLEGDLSKRRILELYLNVIEWGDGIYGCEAAARRYFDKSAADLDAEEAAGLAAMIPSPRRFNPQTNPVGYGRARRRILWMMEHAGYVKRSVAGLGAPPPEPPPEADDDTAPEDGPIDDTAATNDPM